MPIKLYYAVCDGGDGSASVHWFKTQESANKALSYSDDNFDDSYRMNEGEVRYITLPDGTDIDKLGCYFPEDEED